MSCSVIVVLRFFKRRFRGPSNPVQQHPLPPCHVPVDLVRGHPIFLSQRKKNAEKMPWFVSFHVLLLLTLLPLGFISLVYFLFLFPLLLLLLFLYLYLPLRCFSKESMRARPIKESVDQASR